MIGSAARKWLVGQTLTLDADVGIVGAGAAGGVLAFELARRGVRVVVLESGPRHEFARRPDYVRRYLKHQNPWETSPRDLDRQTVGGVTPYRLAGRRVRGVGGSTLHWEGYAFRLHASDFRMRSLYGIADDWPISYSDLEGYYGAAERMLGVAGTDDERLASPRSTPFPLPPFPFSHSDRLFAPACAALGVAFNHMPQARNSLAYGGRSQCRACSTCAVCPTGAKASTDLTLIPQAEATGNARIVPEATVLRLETDRSGHVSAAVYAGRDKVPQRLTARVFVVAAGAVETARLLLLSTSRDFPAGLANRSGLVGKFFMSHPSMDIVGRARENVYPYRIGFSTAMSRQFAIERDRGTRGAFLLEFLNSAGPTPERLAVSSGEWGEALRRRVREEFGRVARDPRVRGAIARSCQLGLAQCADPRLLRHPSTSPALWHRSVRARSARRCQGSREQDPGFNGTYRYTIEQPLLRRTSDRHAPDGHGSPEKRGRRQPPRPRCPQPVPRGQRLLRHRQRLAPDPHHRGAGHPRRRAHRRATRTSGHIETETYGSGITLWAGSAAVLKRRQDGLHPAWLIQCSHASDIGSRWWGRQRFVVGW